jgi:hypothetical protein
LSDTEIVEGNLEQGNFDVTEFKSALANGSINSALFQFNFDNESTMPNIPYLAFKYKLSQSKLKIWFYETEDGIWIDGENTKLIKLSVFKADGTKAYTISLDVEFAKASTKGSWATGNKIKEYKFTYRVLSN